MKRLKVLILVLTSVLFYLGSIIYVDHVRNSRYENLQQYDLNKDGFFSKDEINKDQQMAMHRCTNDSGLNFARYTLIPVSLAFGLVTSTLFYKFCFSKKESMQH